MVFLRQKSISSQTDVVSMQQIQKFWQKWISNEFVWFGEKPFSFSIHHQEFMRVKNLSLAQIQYYITVIKKNLGRNSQMKHPWKTSQIRAKNFKRWIAPFKIWEEIVRWNTLEKPSKFRRRILSGRSHPFRRYRLFLSDPTYNTSQLTHKTVDVLKYTRFEFQNNFCKSYKISRHMLG